MSTSGDLGSLKGSTYRKRTTRRVACCGFAGWPFSI